MLAPGQQPSGLETNSRPTTVVNAFREDTVDQQAVFSIYRRNRLKEELFKSLTVTGTSSKQLVIRGGALIPGNDYIIQLNVTLSGEFTFYLCFFALNVMT